MDLLLIYPYYNDDTSLFKFPPLGLGYIASFVRGAGYSVGILDCTFFDEEEAVTKAKSLKPRVIGISSMSSLKEYTIRLAKRLRGSCELLVAGGPLPTVEPASFVKLFDIVVIGEGEKTMLEVLQALDKGAPPVG